VLLAVASKTKANNRSPVNRLQFSVEKEKHEHETWIAI
jgi:hypothetical protein